MDGENWWLHRKGQVRELPPNLLFHPLSPILSVLSSLSHPLSLYHPLSLSILSFPPSLSPYSAISPLYGEESEFYLLSIKCFQRHTGEYQYTVSSGALLNENLHWDIDLCGQVLGSKLIPSRI